MSVLAFFCVGGFVSSHSPLPSSSTPPPAFEDALRGDLMDASTPLRHRLGPGHVTHHVVKAYRESETVRYLFGVVLW